MQFNWSKKGATLSHKSAMEEFDLTEEEIFEAVNKGKLQCRENNIHGNPFLRLVRTEVEGFVKKKYGADFLKKKKCQNEIKVLKKELRKHRSQIKKIEARKDELEEELKKF